MSSWYHNILKIFGELSWIYLLYKVPTELDVKVLSYYMYAQKRCH